MNKVLISYSFEDIVLARQLAHSLENYRLSTILDKFEVGHGFNFEQVFNNLDAGDFWVVFFSSQHPLEQNSKLDFDAKAKKQLHHRNISIIPVLVSGRDVPLEFKDSKVFNIKKNPERELDKVARYLGNIVNLDFDSLTPMAFEALIVALLEKLRFKNIQVSRGSRDYGYDIQSTSFYRDPFGSKHEVNWIIELKFYKQSRADVQSLSQLSSYLIDLPPNYNGLLITNGQLTSAAKEWLQYNERSKRTRITVVDGVQLREILLKYEDLVEKFFGSRG